MKMLYRVIENMKGERSDEQQNEKSSCSCTTA